MKPKPIDYSRVRFEVGYTSAPFTKDRQLGYVASAFVGKEFITCTVDSHPWWALYRLTGAVLARMGLPHPDLVV